MAYSHENMGKVQAPTVLVIFGITGDLARRKLLPAVWNLFQSGMLPVKFRVVGFARRAFDESALRALVFDALGEMADDVDTKTREEFIKLFSYKQGYFDKSEPYVELEKHLAEIEKSFGVSANRLLYLSVAPTHYEEIFKELRSAGITSSRKNSATRILVEKPFGRDAKTARALDEKLAEFFTEQQIYRIDHYLAKETVQNILNFRFANFIFEPLWNKDGIEKVHIELLEKIGMEGRGSFYGATGALRDVGQNHMLQLLAMVAMENPQSLDAENIRARRAEVLKKLLPIKDISTQALRGRYEGFTDETGIEKDTDAETYFMLRAFLDLPKWEGVPFILESGKRMKERVTRITVYFKNSVRALCPIDAGEGCQNTLTFEVQPEEGITICFFAKKPGFEYELEERKLHFSYKKNSSDLRTPRAYERVIFDSIRGDQTLFTSTEEVHFAWSYITPILEEWKKIQLVSYERGSRGPEERGVIENGYGK